MLRVGADRIVLVGMMGCGKSAVGRILASRLGWPLRDNDAMLRQLFDATPRELLAAGGEEAMHSAELTALRAALAMPPAEQVRRMRRMRAQVTENNIFRWAGRLLSEVGRLAADPPLDDSGVFPAALFNQVPASGATIAARA